MSKASKYYCFLTIGQLLFPTSCTMHENIHKEEGRVPIVLYESIGDTKSILSGTELPDSYTIYASAYFKNQTEKGKDDNYFVAKAFRKHDGLWSANPTLYWPLGGKLDFLFTAFEDTAIDIGDCVLWSEGNSTKGVEVDIPDGNCLDSEILFAATLNRKAANGGSIPIQLNHAQSWLQFMLSSDAADILRIDKIVIENVHTGGILRVGNDICLDAEWSFRGHHRSDVIVPGSEGVILNGGSPSVCDILLPEQESCDISLYYSVKNSASEAWSTSVSSVFRYRANADFWYYGEKTVYTIGFSFQKITFTPTIGTWGDDEKEINVTDSTI